MTRDSPFVKPSQLSVSLLSPLLITWKHVQLINGGIATVIGRKEFAFFARSTWKGMFSRLHANSCSSNGDNRAFRDGNFRWVFPIISSVVRKIAPSKKDRKDRNFCPASTSLCEGTRYTHCSRFLDEPSTMRACRFYLVLIN